MAAVAALVLLVVGGLQRERQRGGGGSLPVASQAPAFVLEGLDGRRVSSNELRGKPMILTFWATWCGVCRDEMPDLERLAAVADGRYRLLAVSREPKATLSRWASQNSRMLEIMHDVGGRASHAYRVESLPTHVIIDGEGRIVHDFSGAADPDILFEHMQKLM